jgi:Protein ENHANCED DISEASE RESISTANCE 2, C-terminal
MLRLLVCLSNCLLIQFSNCLRCVTFDYCIAYVALTGFRPLVQSLEVYINRLQPAIWDHGILIEGRNSDELPEVLLGSVRGYFWDFANVKPFPVPALLKSGTGNPAGSMQGESAGIAVPGDTEVSGSDHSDNSVELAVMGDSSGDVSSPYALVGNSAGKSSHSAVEQSQSFAALGGLDASSCNDESRPVQNTSLQDSARSASGSSGSLYASASSTAVFTAVSS